MPVEIDRLNDRLQRETVEYRKGEVVTVKESKGITVTEIYDMPETPETGELVDVHFMKVGFTEAACDPIGFKMDLKLAFGHGEFAPLSLADLQGGPSYITLGGWLGSQDMALRFIALGKHYDFWDVVTPALLGMNKELADQMAGQGLVMNSGVRPGVLDV